MATEAKLQSEVIRYLKELGCVVAKMQAGPGVPVGMSDVFWCYKRLYGFLEVKDSKDAHRQPGQEPFIRMMQGWGVPAYFVYPENWGEVKNNIKSIIKAEDEGRTRQDNY